MPRLLKLTALLMGVISLAMTTFGWRLRSTGSEFVPTIIDNSSPQKMRLLQVWPGVPQPLELTPTFPDLQILGTDTDGNAICFVTDSSILPLLDVYCVTHETRKMELLVQGAANGSIAISPDKKWLIYGVPNQNNEQTTWLLNRSTGQRWRISELVIGRAGLLPQNGRLFSPDSQSLYLAVRFPAKSVFNIIRLALGPDNLPHVAADAEVRVIPKLMGVVGDWLIIQSGQRLDRLDKNGENFGRLIDDEWRPQEGFLTEDIFALYDSFGVVVVWREDTRISVEISTRRELWDGQGFITLYEAPNGWFWVDDGETQPYLLHLPTGQTAPIPLDPEMLNYADPLLIDDRWVFFTLYDQKTGHNSWWRLNRATGQSHRIRENLLNGAYAGISQNGEWIYLFGFNQLGGFHRLRVADGHLETFLNEGYYRQLFWMRPFTRAWHPAPLILISLALILIGIMPRRLLKLP